MSSLKHPPEFNPEDGLAYEELKNDVNIWRLYTKEEIKKQGPAIYLSLRGDAREAVRDIPLNDLSGDNGFEKTARYCLSGKNCIFLLFKKSSWLQYWH